MVLGFEKARDVVLQKDGIEALLIYEEDGALKVWMSPGIDADAKKQ